MLPIEHFIVAVVPVLAYVLLREQRLPSMQLFGVVFVGSQFPDLVDKPLAHYLGILPSGRVFMHSLPTAIPVILLVGYYGYRTDRLRLGVAYGFAHLSHIAADNYKALLRPNPQLPPDVLWPFQPPIARPLTPGWAGPNGVNVQLWTLFSVVVLSVLAYVLIEDIDRHW